MAGKDKHRRFGWVRELPSGRFQASYLGPDGRRRYAPNTFERKGDAEKFLSLIEAQMLQGQWIDPEKAKVKLADYAVKWIKERSGLRPRTVELYRRLLRRHIEPYFGSASVGDITGAMVREWRTALLDGGVSASVTAKAYRLLRAVLMTAVDDRLILRNPCRIKGAGDETPDERPVLTVAQVFELAKLVGRHPVGNIRKLPTGEFRLRFKLTDGDARTFPETFETRAAAQRVLWSMADDGGRVQVNLDDRFRALALLATFASLRWGEAIALRRQDINLHARTVTVRRQYLELDSGDLVIGPPKSRAGSRTVVFPANIVPMIREHLDDHVGSDPSALVFTGASGGVLRRGNFRRASRWAEAAAALGLPGLHFHDLRHTGNTFAAQSGASLRDLMDRMGHDSVRAAMIYQHGTSEAGKAIADALNDRIQATQDSDDDEGDDGDEGLGGALVPVA